MPCVWHDDKPRTRTKTNNVECEGCWWCFACLSLSCVVCASFQKKLLLHNKEHCVDSPTLCVLARC